MKKNLLLASFLGGLLASLLTYIYNSNFFEYYFITSRELTQKHEDSITKLVKNYIDKNPEIIVNSFKEYQKNQQSLYNNQIKKILLDNKKTLLSPLNSIVIGNNNAKNNIIVFFDYLCTYCRSSHNTIKKIIQLRDDIKFTLIPVPLLNKQSHENMQLIFASLLTDKKLAFEINERLMQKPFINDKELFEILNKFDNNNEEIFSSSILNSANENIKNIVEIVKLLNITSVPSFFYNNQKLELSSDNLKEYISKIIPKEN